MVPLFLGGLMATNSNIYRAQNLANDYATKQFQIKPNYSYSFSGADAKTFVFFPFAPDMMEPLLSVHTVSVSIHEAKAPARALGHRGIKGVARSVRTIAGSIILTVVNDHPLRPLMSILAAFTDAAESVAEIFPNWAADNTVAGIGTYKDIYSFQNRISGLLPPFNMILEFVAENAPVILDHQGTTYATTIEALNGEAIFSHQAQRSLYPSAGMMLEGIEIIDEGFVVSVNDQVTEFTLSYIAKDIKPISGNIFSLQEEPIPKITLSELQAKEAALISALNPNTHATVTTLSSRDKGAVQVGETMTIIDENGIQEESELTPWIDDSKQGE